MNRVGLPPGYDRVLDIWAAHAPLAAARARAALALLLGDLMGSPSPDAFRQSTLTMTRSPFEPAFACVAPGIRYTVDPSPSEIDLLSRLEYVLALLARLHAPTCPSYLLDRLAPLQVGGTLRFGAHIGVRHGDLHDHYKLYIELPPEAETAADAFAEEVLASPPLLNVPDRDARPTLVGIDLDSGSLEIYYRIENLHPLEIAALMGRAHGAERAPEVLAMLAATQPRPIRHTLPGSTWGFSYSLHRDKTITFSLYTFARTLFGPDGWARSAVLSMGQRHGWDLCDYARMSAPLEGKRGFLCHHGIFGLVAPPGRPLSAWIGLAPPQEDIG